MKSKIYSCKGGLLGDTLKRYWWFGFLSFLATLFTDPVFILSRLGSLRMRVERGNEYAAAELLEFVTNFFFGNGSYILADVVIALLLGAGAGLIFFGFLHRKKQVDFYLAQPVSRESLLNVRFLAGLLLYGAGLLLNLLISYFILLSAGASAGCFVGLLGRFFYLIICFGCLYALSILCACLTGNPFGHLQVGFLLSFGGSLLCACVVWLCEVFFKTFPGIDAKIPSSFSLPVHMVYSTSQSMPGLGRFLLYLAIFALLYYLASLALRKRPAEAVGGLLVFPALEPVFRALLCTLTAFGLSAMLHAVLSRTSFLVFGMALGLFLGHLCAQGQIKRSFGGMFSGWRPLLVTAAALCVLVSVFATDLFGYDRYLPAREEVSAVALRVNGDDTFNYIPGNTNGDEGVMDYATLSDPAVVDAALALARSGIDSASRPEDMEAYYGKVNTLGYTIRYTLTGGRQVTRRYLGVPVDSAAEGLLQAMRSPAYIEKHGLFHLEPADCNYITLNADAQESYNPSTATQRQQFVAALRQDVMEHGLAPDSAAFAYAELGYRVNQPQTDPDLPRQTTQYLQFPLRLCYSRTLSLIAEWGIEGTAVPEKVLEQAVWVEIVQNGAEEPAYVTEDPARIRAILTSDVITGYYGTPSLTEPYSVNVFTQRDLDTGLSLAEAEKYAMDAMDIYGVTRFGASYSYGIMLGGLTMDKIGFEP